jgi:hypothetical protein
MKRRRLLIALGIVVAVLVVIRLVLDPIAAWQTHEALDKMEGFSADFSRVHVSVLPPAYEIHRLKIIEGEHHEHPDRAPVFYVERLRLGVVWRRLLHGELAATLRVDEPKITIVQRQETPKPKEDKARKPAPDLSAQLGDVLPVNVDRVELFAGEILFRDATEEKPAEVWLHKLELVAQNLATRLELAGGRPTTVSAHGVLGHSGDLTLYVSADPFARPLAFAGQLAVRGFKAAELFAFLDPKAHVQTPEGTIDVFAEFVTRGGRLSGGVKPVLKNIEVRSTESGWWPRLKAWLGDKAVELASDRVPDRNAVATTIPIKGDLTAPDIQLWPAVLGVLRNAFVQGLSSGFTNLPPSTSQDQESPLAQAKNALTKDEGPPKAQPAEKPADAKAGDPKAGTAREASAKDASTKPSVSGRK